MTRIGDVLEGLQIIAEYSAKGVDEDSICAEHEMIYAGQDVDLEQMSEDDVTKMDELGWSFEEDKACWARFT